MTDNSEKRTLDLPDDIDLPFFAYGIFKPGQLAHSKIKGFANEITDDIEINYKMKTRDGVPILIDNENEHYNTKGSLITFKETRKEKAYALISKTMLRALYEWKTIKIDGDEANVLIGKNTDYGSYPIEDLAERVSFDGKRDPLFSDAIELIENNLNYDKSRNEKSFFELQMNYMLLWSAIERYSSIKYNKRNKAWNNKQFSKEKAFKKGIMKFKDEYHQPIYSTDDLKVHKFNEEDPYETLLYYYTFRCNVVHRGKAMISDYFMLKKAAEELLVIFKDVLKDTFEEI